MNDRRGRWDEPDRCPSRFVYKGKSVARCFFKATEPHDRHHNGTRWWTDASKGARNG